MVPALGQPLGGAKGTLPVPSALCCGDCHPSCLLVALLVFAAFPGQNHSHGDSEQVTEGLTKDFQDDAPRYYLCTSFQAGEGSLPSLKSAQRKENKLYLFFHLSFPLATEGRHWTHNLEQPEVGQQGM